MLHRRNISLGDGAPEEEISAGSFCIARAPLARGARALHRRAIPKGACVVEYTGRVLKGDEEYTSRSKYLFEVSKKVTIDGAARSNIARYINHACKPNCEIDIFRGRVFVMAKRNIKAGEELTYDYDTDYFNEHIKPKGCRCKTCAPGLYLAKEGVF